LDRRFVGRSEGETEMTRPKIGIVGGGLAGLSAAVACGDAGAQVTLFEGRTRLGGATWSTQRDGLWIDNGQHVFLRCCHSYIGFLRRLGVMDHVDIQPRLEIPVLMPGRKPTVLKRGNLPAPLHMTSSLLRFTHLDFSDRIRVGRAAIALRNLDLSDRSLDDQTFGSWLSAHGQSDASLNRFWDLFTRATVNLPVGESSLALAAKVFQTGLLTKANAGDIGISRVPLTHLHGDPAAIALDKLKTEIKLRAPVETILSGPQGEPSIQSRGQSFPFDAVIVAAPHDVTAEILPDEAKVDRAALRALGTSPIVNLHIIYDRPVTDMEFCAGVETPMQWIFDRTQGAGLQSGQYLAVSLSVADAYVGRSREELRAEFAPALEELFPAAKAANITSFFSTCERSATFRGAPGSAAMRPGPQTGVKGISLAGAWTDTGWPATMEGAVRSGLKAARCALLSAGVERGLPDEVPA
jgi:squalene-associated FAD-dependent desaturase